MRSYIARYPSTRSSNTLMNGLALEVCIRNATFLWTRSKQSRTFAGDVYARSGNGAFVKDVHRWCQFFQQPPGNTVKIIRGDNNIALLLCNITPLQNAGSGTYVHKLPNRLVRKALAGGGILGYVPFCHIRKEAIPGLQHFGCWLILE